MRHFLVLIAVICCAFADFTDPKYVAMRKNCIEHSNVDEELVDRAKQGDFDTDDNLKQYLKCLMDHDHVQGWNDDGSINLENLMEAIPPKLMPVFEKPVQECKDEIEHDGNLGNVAFRLARCVYSKTLDKFDMP